MELKVNKKTINEIDFCNELHDSIASDYSLISNAIEVIFKKNNFNSQKTYKMLINFGKKPFDYINSYQYSIKNGKIKGSIIEFSDFIALKKKFQLIDILFSYSTLTLKGSIINDGMQNRNIVLIEFNFEKDDFSIELSM